MLVFVLLASLAGCADDKSAARGESAPLRVSVVHVGQIETAAQIETAGTAALRKEIPLGFTSPGRIARILVQEGDFVRRGQLLAVLDTTTAGAALEAAAAERDRARAELERLRKLYGQGWITKARFESAEATARSATANLIARRFLLETARIVAPANGIVLARTAEPSQIIDAGSPVVTLGDSGSGFVLRVLLADRDAVRLRTGIEAEVDFEALPGTKFSGRVIEVGGRSDRGSGAYTAEIAVPSDARLRSGLVGTARILAPSTSGSTRIVIPPTAVFAARADEGFVYVVGGDHKVRARKLALGALGSAGIEVLGGLMNGEAIVTSGLDRLREGAAVDPVRAAP